MTSQLTITGNLAADAELRYTPAGKPVLNLTIMQTTRERNEEGEWVDGTPLIWNVKQWGQPAEAAAPYMRKGVRVIATGRVSQKQHESKQGYKINQTELIADELGLSVKFGLND